MLQLGWMLNKYKTFQNDYFFSFKLKLCRLTCQSFADVASQWQNWGSYSPCSVTCGDGYTKRTRKCVGSNQRKYQCQGVSTQIKECKRHPCSGQHRPLSLFAANSKPTSSKWNRSMLVYVFCSKKVSLSELCLFFHLMWEQSLAQKDESCFFHKILLWKFVRA